MKFLITTLIWMMIQFQPFILANPLPQNSSQENYLEFYENELFSMAENFCEKFKNTSENLLSTKELQEPPTPELKELKNSLHYFLQDYPLFKRYKLQPILLMTFIKLQNTEEKQMEKFPELVKKFKEIFSKYLGSLIQEYETNYIKFMKGKFLNKLEDLKNNLELKDFIKNKDEINNFIDLIKSCQGYQCFFPYNDPMFLKPNVSKEIQLKFIKEDFKQYAALLAICFNTVGQRILKSEKLNKLSLETRNNLTLDINDFNTKLEISENIVTFINSIPVKSSFPQKYLNNSNFPLEDREILHGLLNPSKSIPGDNIYDILSLTAVFILIKKIVLISFVVKETDLEDLSSVIEFLKSF